ncbi:MAG: T9SS type A sorting domain-containing protein [Saprospiraceae bacterium]|nr:T9SS type A sorting domain-containing protein [Saprospiraceae bacterium]
MNFKDLHLTHIFPNPANDVLDIDLSNYKNQAVDIYLYNNLGQQKLYDKVENATNALLELDVSALPSGSYMVRLVSKGKRELTKPVIITH